MIRFEIVAALLLSSACQPPVDMSDDNQKAEPSVSTGVIPKAPNLAVFKIDKTAWHVISVNDRATQATKDDDGVLLKPKIEFASGNASGFSGCNSFGGLYSQIDGKLYFGRSISTEQGCSDALGMQENALYALLAGEVDARVDAQGHLFLKRGTQKAVLERAKDCVSCKSAWQPKVNLVGPVWNIEAINGQNPTGRDVFKNENNYMLKFTANSFQFRVGCNTISGSYRLEVNRLITSSGVATEIGCSPELLAQDQLVSRILSENPSVVHGHNMDMMLTSKAGMIELQGPPDQRK